MPHAGAIDAVEHHVVLVEISTYAPRVGSDPSREVCGVVAVLFQLALPVWGATGRLWRYYRGVEISTHAPRVGSDRENEI